MTRFRVLAVLPVAWALLFLAGDALLRGTAAYPYYLRTEVELVKTLMLAGTWAAAFALAPGDYQRRAWFLIGGCMALLLLRDLTIAPFMAGLLNEEAWAWVRGGMVVLGNAAQVVGTWMLARAWQVADLALPGSRRGQVALVVGVAVLVLAVTGPGIVRGTGELAAGNAAGLTGLASAMGDAISLCLIAPLLLTALALRGGLFVWPWALLTASDLTWLFYDGFALLAAGQLEIGTRRTITETFRALGCMYGFGAGMAQVLVVRGLRGLAARRSTELPGAA